MKVLLQESRLKKLQQFKTDKWFIKCSNHHHHHHIRFWYLWCCGSPGLRGRQCLTLVLHEFLSNGLTPSRLRIVISFLTHADHVFLGLPRSPTISGDWKPQSRDGVDARSGTLYVPADLRRRVRRTAVISSRSSWQAGALQQPPASPGCG